MIASRALWQTFVCTRRAPGARGYLADIRETFERELIKKVRPLESRVLAR
jgi:hypothetical protein